MLRTTSSTICKTHVAMLVWLLGSVSGERGCAKNWKTRLLTSVRAECLNKSAEKRLRRPTSTSMSSDLKDALMEARSQFASRPHATVEEIAELEQALATALPAEYKEFLL